MTVITIVIPNRTGSKSLACSCAVRKVTNGSNGNACSCGTLAA
ncbi:hypothetical protein CLV65_0945 [Pseudoscardovia suis]|uniref:Uncharacterized protein n=1 Tax=Pseudoscardovia suis TaxID=987063 RepID=A0A261F1Q8_9BIFI|nr:hypothetical protein PSSU_0484 [Pseudoscardovia suis]PJJ68370.1 hypothetical protein CLV65_0945 [Pseudoscardovia suis]